MSHVCCTFPNKIRFNQLLGNNTCMTVLLFHHDESVFEVLVCSNFNQRQLQEQKSENLCRFNSNFLEFELMTTFERASSQSSQNLPNTGVNVD